MLKLPLTHKPTNTGAVALLDAAGAKVATIRTAEMHGAAAINNEAGETITQAVNDHDELLDTLEALAQYVGGWDAPISHPCGRAAALLKRYNRPA